MTLEIIVASLAVLAYLFGCYADERRSRRHGKRLRPVRDYLHEREALPRLREQDAQRPRMPLPSSP